MLDSIKLSKKDKNKGKQNAIKAMQEHFGIIVFHYAQGVTPPKAGDNKKIKPPKPIPDKGGAKSQPLS